MYLFNFLLKIGEVIILTKNDVISAKSNFYSWVSSCQIFGHADTLSPTEILDQPV